MELLENSFNLAMSVLLDDGVRSWYLTALCAGIVGFVLIFIKRRIWNVRCA